MKIIYLDLKKYALYTCSYYTAIITEPNILFRLIALFFTIFNVASWKKNI